MVAFFQQVGGADDRMFFAPVRSATRADKEKLAQTPTVGVKVMAPWTNGKLYPGKVSRVTGAGVVTILFDDGDVREGVAWKACKARATGTVSIHEAIRRKDLQAVKKCIESGRDVNVKGPDGNYPLASAAHDGLTEIVDTLLLNGAEVNKQAATGATALHYASFRGHAACVRRLVDAGADVHLEAWNAPPLTPLESAISHKRTAVVRILAPLTKDRHASKKAENAAADSKDIDLFEAVRIGDVEQSLVKVVSIHTIPGFKQTRPVQDPNTAYCTIWSSYMCFLLILNQTSPLRNIMSYVKFESKEDKFLLKEIELYTIFLIERLG